MARGTSGPSQLAGWDRPPPTAGEAPTLGRVKTDLRATLPCRDRFKAGDNAWTNCARPPDSITWKFPVAMSNISVLVGSFVRKGKADGSPLPHLHTEDLP